MYGIKDVFLTLQGEGARAGTKAVFVRFSGCNLWDGHPLHRDSGEGPCAAWCDTDFFKGQVASLADLIESMNEAFNARPDSSAEKWCVLTGGEPGLQVDAPLIETLHEDGWCVAVETNGTIDSTPLRMCDHICVSPKRGTSWRNLRKAHEVKVILPGAAIGEEGWTDEELVAMWDELSDSMKEPRFYVQAQDPLLSKEPGETLLTLTHKHGSGSQALQGVPEDEPRAVLKAIYDQHIERCVDFVMRYPEWRLSLQAHKYIDLP